MKKTYLIIAALFSIIAYSNNPATANQNNIQEKPIFVKTTPDLLKLNNLIKQSIELSTQCAIQKAYEFSSNPPTPTKIIEICVCGQKKQYNSLISQMNSIINKYPAMKNKKITFKDEQGELKGFIFSTDDLVKFLNACK